MSIITNATSRVSYRVLSELAQDSGAPMPPHLQKVKAFKAIANNQNDADKLIIFKAIATLQYHIVENGGRIQSALFGSGVSVGHIEDIVAHILRQIPSLKTSKTILLAGFEGLAEFCKHTMWGHFNLRGISYTDSIKLICNELLGVDIEDSSKFRPLDPKAMTPIKKYYYKISVIL